MKTQISTFTFNGQDIDVLYVPKIKELSYIFEHKGQRYGNAVKIEGAGVLPVMRATMCLLINYIETKEATQKI